jgi:hypothetical protein
MARHNSSHPISNDQRSNPRELGECDGVHLVKGLGDQ